jgi:hypothetical protein
VTKLPAKEAQYERWQTAMEVLLQAAEETRTDDARQDRHAPRAAEGFAAASPERA